MPSIGDTKVEFTRSYVFLNPPLSEGAYNNELGVGAWRLSVDDTASGGGGGGGGGGAITASAVVDASSPTIVKNQLIYITSTGTCKPAIATSFATSKVAGVATETIAPGNALTYSRNFNTDITTTASVIDGSPAALVPNTWYFLSATNAGHWTTTPDVTTVGNVVIQCGLATGTIQMTVEIQPPTVI